MVSMSSKSLPSVIFFFLLHFSLLFQLSLTFFSVLRRSHVVLFYCMRRNAANVRFRCQGLNWLTFLILVGNIARKLDESQRISCFTSCDVLLALSSPHAHRQSVGAHNEMEKSKKMYSRLSFSYRLNFRSLTMTKRQSSETRTTFLPKAFLRPF